MCQDTQSLLKVLDLGLNAFGILWIKTKELSSATFSPAFELNNAQASRDSQAFVKIVVLEKHEYALVDKKQGDCKCEIGHDCFFADVLFSHDAFGYHFLGLVADEHVYDHLDEEASWSCSLIAGHKL